MNNPPNRFEKPLYNRTKRYLLPILNTYPKLFKLELSKIKYELYIGDVDYYRTRPFANHLFLLTSFNKNIINATKDTKWFHDEYPVNLTDTYCLVLNIPQEFQDSYNNFLLGDYSKMYSKKQLSTLGISSILNGEVNITHCILTHNELAYEEYKRVLKDVYKSNHYPLNPKEYDVPPRIRMEFLNSIGNEDFVKSICSMRNL